MLTNAPLNSAMSDNTKKPIMLNEQYCAVHTSNVSVIRDRIFNIMIYQYGLSLPNYRVLKLIYNVAWI